MDCIFCKIVSGVILSKKVYEDENVLCFHDLNPQAPVHILICSFPRTKRTPRSFFSIWLRLTLF